MNRCRILFSPVTMKHVRLVQRDRGSTPTPGGGTSRSGLSLEGRKDLYLFVSAQLGPRPLIEADLLTSIASAIAAAFFLLGDAA